jgi:hypothetical protein
MGSGFMSLTPQKLPMPSSSCWSLDKWKKQIEKLKRSKRPQASAPHKPHTMSPTQAMDAGVPHVRDFKDNSISTFNGSRRQRVTNRQQTIKTSWRIQKE